MDKRYAGFLQCGGYGPISGIFDAHELSDEHREIVETAIEDGYSDRGSIAPELNAHVNLISSNEHSPESLVKYDREYYAWTCWHNN